MVERRQTVHSSDYVWKCGVCVCLLNVDHCSYTVLDLTNRPLYTLINVSLQHVKPSQPETEKPRGNIPEEKRNISQSNNANEEDSQRKNVTSHKSNSSVKTLPEKKSNSSSSTERWYTVTYQETENGKEKH